MTESLTRQLLELVYHDPAVRRPYKDSLADWILDTQSRTAPLSASSLLEYLAVHQADVLQHLKSNVRFTDEIAQALREADRGQVSRD